MPFNSAIVGSGGARIMLLADLTVEDLALAYDVEAEIALQYPTLAPTRAGDTIRLLIGPVNLAAADVAGYAIDADGLHDAALFFLTMEAGSFIFGKGGVGGKGGDGSDFAPVEAGFPGLIGGTAMRLGCVTDIAGIGTIEQGYGGGGGASGNSTGAGGSGGGGGAAFALGGLGGLADGEGSPTPGDPGEVATLLLGGLGGTENRDGGVGGSNGIAPEEGEGGLVPGGIGGANGDSIHTQGFTLTFDPNITPVGPII